MNLLKPVCLSIGLLQLARSFKTLPIASVRYWARNFNGNNYIRDKASLLQISSNPELEFNSEHDFYELTLKNLLVAEASASVQYYWREFREEIMPRWLSDFEKKHNGVNEVGWERFFNLLMRADPEEMVIRKVSLRKRGGSGNNPYLPSQSIAMEYTVKIEPIEIANKIMKVREQLSEEWMHDLALIEQENLELLRHYGDTMRMEKKDADKMRKPVFEYSFDDSEKSPYREKNYKKLVSLVTKIAIRRYQSELRIKGQYHVNNWVERFLSETDRSIEGNALLEAMLNGPLVMINPKETGDSGKLSVIEPVQITKGIMLCRTIAAEEFRSILAYIPNDHTRLKCEMLKRSFYLHDLIGDGTMLVKPDLGDSTP